MTLPVGNQKLLNDTTPKIKQVRNISEKKRIKKSFSYIQDPGHGWLSVSHEDIIATGVKSLISPYSYMNSTRVFLEEDRDMSIFLDAAKILGWDVELKSSTVDKTSIRGYAVYNQEWIDNPFIVGRIVYLLNGIEATVSEKTTKGWNIKASSGQIYRLPRLNPLARILPSFGKEQNRVG